MLFSLSPLLLALGGAFLGHHFSETWWWISALDTLPPQLWLPLVLWSGWRDWKRRSDWGLLCALRLQLP